MEDIERLVERRILENYRIFTGVELRGNSLVSRAAGKDSRVVKYLGEMVRVKEVEDTGRYYGVEREIYCYYAIQHRNVVECFGFFQGERKRYLVLKFYSLSLENFINCERANPQVIIAILLELLDLFEYLSCRHMHFERLSLSDVFIDDDCSPKVFDLSTLLIDISSAEVSHKDTLFRITERLLSHKRMNKHYSQTLQRMRNFNETSFSEIKDLFLEINRNC